MCGRGDDAAAPSVEYRTTDRSSCSTGGWLDAEVALRPGGRIVEAVHLRELLALSSWGLEGTDSRCQTEKGAWSLHGLLRIDHRAGAEIQINAHRAKKLANRELGNLDLAATH